MTLYRIAFELRSAIVTPLKGDTIWGHIVWGIANHEGDDAVAKFLEQEKADPPALVVSSAFPAGMLRRPLPEPKKREKLDGNSIINRYSQIKKDKKSIYVSASEYFTGMETIPAISGNPLTSVQVMHNKIDRETNEVLDGGLYSTEEQWPGIMEGSKFKPVDWDLYVLSSFEKTRVAQLVAWAFENGYGADASTGKGKIIIKGEPVPVTPQKAGNTYMALGPFVDSPGSGILNLRADIFVRSGKAGGAFAASLSPYKKPVVLYQEGAVFSGGKSFEYAGMLLTEMHGEDPRICQSGFAPVIPIG
jgi:CRISPR-associated protein Csm4